MPVTFTSEPAVLVPAFGANGAVFGYENSVSPPIVFDTGSYTTWDANNYPFYFEVTTDPTAIDGGSGVVTESDDLANLPIGATFTVVSVVEANPGIWRIGTDLPLANASGFGRAVITKTIPIDTVENEQIHVGYPTGHPLNGVWPEALAVTLRPKEVSANVFLPTDVAPYLQHYFKPVPPVQGSNPYWLVPFRFAVVTSDSNGVDVVNYSPQKYATMGNQLPFCLEDNGAATGVDLLQNRKAYTPNELDFAIALGQNYAGNALLQATLTVNQ